MVTELEGCVLGIVWERGPCTTYAIRQVFLNSPAPHWSGSAGAIYPLVERLVKRRLLRAKRSAVGRRNGSVCLITAAGRRALREWLGPPLPGWAVGVPADPLRTRLRFLAALPAARRQAFVQEALVKLRGSIRMVEADRLRRKRLGDPFSYLVASGALGMLQARLAWLVEVKGVLRRQVKPSGSRASGRSGSGRAPASS